MVEKFRRKVLFFMIAFLFLFSTTGIVSAETSIGKKHPDEIILPDFSMGNKSNTLSLKDNGEEIEKLLDEKILINRETEILQEQFRGNVLSQETINKFSEMQVRVDAIENRLSELGVIKLSEEQKMEYIYSSTNYSTNSIGPKNPPAGIDFYVYYFNHSYNGKTYQIGRVLAQPTYNAVSPLVRNYSWVEFSPTKISDYGSKLFRITLEEAISSLLPVKGVAFAYNAIKAIAAPLLPSTKYSNSSIVSLKVQLSSRVMHTYVKDSNNKYQFRIATNRSFVRETWDLSDVNGDSHRDENYYWTDSNHYQDWNYAVSITSGYQNDFVKTFRYQQKNIFGIWSSKLSVIPYHASLPIQFEDI